MIDKDSLADKTLSILEYPHIMENVASLAVSEEASSVLRESKPCYDPAEAEETKEFTAALLALIKNGTNEPRAWLPAIGFLLPKTEKEGVVLELDEALAIGLFIERGEALMKWAIGSTADNGINAGINTGVNNGGNKTIMAKHPLFELHGNMTDCRQIAAEIFKIIDREGKLRDIPSLRAIKKRIGSLEKELKTIVSGYALDEEYKKMLQSTLPSQRDGRTVLAVKTNYRGRIRGIVHEVSSTGQTVFVEPLDVVDKNNEILLEKRNLDIEIQKIFRELTEKICSISENLRNFHRVIIDLECLRARARYSLETKGHFACPASCGDGLQPDSLQADSHAVSDTLILKRARHPLLKKAVPIDVEMKSGTRTLVITGPNTGGKTVALKTLGLLAMMNQSGLALPLDEGSAIPFFDGIYADIGDEQSIDQSLSTFSAHITNISAITANATEKSLVLLDELGSGTDPEEGGAIAMAILDFLIEKKSRMVITTHHGILKNYGYTRQGVENASVEFDAHTLSPTYKIINGVPGESRALDIAGANGLDPAIVEKARRYIDEDKSDISALISGLEQKHRELAGIEQKSAIEQNRLKEAKRKADLKELQLRQKEAELKRETVGKLQLLLRESRKTLENLVRELNEAGPDREKNLKVKEFLKELARNVEDESSVLDDEERIIREQFMDSGSPAAAAAAAVAAEAAAVEFIPGMEVYAGPSRQRGVIVRTDKKSLSGNSWVVKVGSLKMSFPEKELLPVPSCSAAGDKKGAKSNNRASKGSSSSYQKPDLAKVSWAAELSPEANNAVYELKLLGMRLEEAKEALRRQIEAALLGGLKTFYVVHGTGSGILQKGIHEYLKNEPAVEDYYFSRPEQGGFGRTEVVLRHEC